MKYANGSAFRRALEDRLREQSLQGGVSLTRLRKMVAFDRFLARLGQSAPGLWVLKGGFALQLRLKDSARTTKDIDLLVLTNQDDVHRTLVAAGKLYLGDWFAFDVANPVQLLADELGGRRFRVRSLLDGRLFEEFHLDIGVGDPIVEEVEYLKTPAPLEFAGFPSTIVPCYPITQQIAEKLHAMTRSHASGEGTRIKDLIDILLLAELGRIDGKHLTKALKATFDARQTHSLPSSFPDLPTSWAVPFRRLSADVGLNYPSMEDAENAVKNFLNPILRGEEIGRWDPVEWSWQRGLKRT